MFVMVSIVMRVIKRGKYFYLQHSFRQDGKVVTREKYLGKEVPENVDALARKLMREWQGDLYAKLEKIGDNFRRSWDRCPESARQREMQEIGILFTYNTNAIEGSTITLSETRGVVVDKVAPNKALRDVLETDAHFDVFLGMLNKRERISVELLLGWHEGIFGKTKEDIAGKFRDYLVRVGAYTAPDWQDVSGLMDELVGFVGTERMSPVELAARAHYRFEKIHPFGDGNGRVGRLLMNHILWHGGYPMLIIEYVKRKSYYRALEKDEEGFVRYFFRRYLSAHGKVYG